MNPGRIGSPTYSPREALSGEIVKQRPGQVQRLPAVVLFLIFRLIGLQCPAPVEGEHPAQVMAYHLERGVALHDTGEDQAGQGEGGLKRPAEVMNQVILGLVAPPRGAGRVDGMDIDRDTHGGSLSPEGFKLR